MNPNYVVVIKQDLDKLSSVSFIAHVEKVNWLSPIIVVPLKNDEFKIYKDFWWLNVATKKHSYPLPFIEEVLDKIVGHELYSFLDGCFGYYHIMIAPKDKYKTTFIIDWGAFIWVVMPFGLKNSPTTYQRVVNTIFEDYFGVFMKLLLDDFNVFSDLDTHLTKLQLCFDKCKEFDISLNLEKCIWVSSWVMCYPRKVSC